MTIRPSSASAPDNEPDDDIDAVYKYQDEAKKRAAYQQYIQPKEPAMTLPEALIVFAFLALVFFAGVITRFL